jgi:hypothetical protein
LKVLSIFFFEITKKPPWFSDFVNKKCYKNIFILLRWHRQLTFELINDCFA